VAYVSLVVASNRMRQRCVVALEVEMKGIMFNLVEEVVTDRFGADTWNSLLGRAGLDGAYTPLESYPDGDLFRLVGAAERALEVSADEVLREFGEAALPLFAERYPAFFAPFKSTRPFLLTLNDVIHPEMRHHYPGAEMPDFDFNTSDPEVLVIGYRSARRLCALAEGFIIGAARLYHQDSEVSQLSCLKEGDPKCLIACRFMSFP
jgi:Haem-NO-binding